MHHLNYLALIGVIVAFICLVISVTDRKMFTYPYVNVGLCVCFFVVSFLLFGHSLGEQYLSVSESTLQMQSLALENNLSWVASPATTNAIIAVVCVFAVLIFFLLQFVGLRTKKIMIGFTVILACIYFLEVFFILLTPEASAMQIGWYKGAVEYLSRPEMFYLKWMLQPLLQVAIVELWLSVTHTLGMAIAICLLLTFGVDYVRTKVGI